MISDDDDEERSFLMHAKPLALLPVRTPTRMLLLLAIMMMMMMMSKPCSIII
jgi:hypothetical protein